MLSPEMPEYSQKKRVSKQKTCSHYVETVDCACILVLIFIYISGLMHLDVNAQANIYPGCFFFALEEALFNPNPHPSSNHNPYPNPILTLNLVFNLESCLYY